MANQIRWTPEKLDRLRRLYPEGDTVALAMLFNVTPNALKNTAKRYGIRKTHEYRSMISSPTQFFKGQTPFNKGRKRTEWCSPEGIAIQEVNQFKKGHRPHTELPVGTERVRPDTGKMQVKVSDDGKTARQRWKPKHHIVWKETKGKLPEGYDVVFADGDVTNFDPDNLELRRKGDIKRHIPRELRQLSGLKGALQRRINETKRKQKQQ